MRVWLDGRLLADPAEAALPAVGPGVGSGLGVFETVRADHGRPFALGLHLERLDLSARTFGLHSPERETWLEGVAAVTDAYDAPPALGRLRLTCLASRGPRPLCVVSIEPADAADNPANVITSRWRRNERSPVAGIKSTSYAESLLAWQEATAAGADEALVADSRGRLSEGTRSNVFYRRGEQLVTPPLSTGCLPGVTRRLVVDVARRLGIEVVERAERIEEVSEEAEDLLLTSSMREVQPVGVVDGRALEAGPLTRRLCQAWAEQRGRLAAL